jgi:hypothetical protein
MDEKDVVEEAQDLLIAPLSRALLQYLSTSFRRLHFPGLLFLA